jgi:hypothetical protein
MDRDAPGRKGRRKSVRVDYKIVGAVLEGRGPQGVPSGPRDRATDQWKLHSVYGVAAAGLPRQAWRAMRTLHLVLVSRGWARLIDWRKEANEHTRRTLRAFFPFPALSAW